LQKRADAPGPGGFIVLRAFYTLVVKVSFELPTLLEEDVAKFFDIVNDTWAFVRADVEPNARTWLDGSSGGEAMDDALIPPDGWREGCQAAEDSRMLQSQIK